MDPRGAIYPTWDSWVTAMQVGSAVFAAATTTEAHVQCRIAHKDLTLEATGPQPYVTPAAWVTAFHLAVVCRERDRITALCRVPLSLLRENGGVTQEDRSQLITGLVALAPLAMACFAREAGISKSDYLPAVLLNGNWLGEFPT
ncbi:immunity 49 family protein [Streptomyces sp. NPDC002467]|uniref:immunity 49 family protein n=1 Tax=Streptomyces sp. NPDC002467 TaxID=3364647 RepID=UPI003688E76A